MRRLVLWGIGGVFLINLIGISLICLNFLNFSNEVEKTILINRSLPPCKGTIFTVIIPL